VKIIEMFEDVNEKIRKREIEREREREREELTIAMRC